MSLRTMAIRILSCVILCVGAPVLAACKGEATSTQTQQPTDVEVVEVIQQDVPIYSEWVGTTDGHVNARIRPQISGYLLKRAYEEGASVKTGDLLFEIDPRKFQAALDQARGELGTAQAQLGKTELDVQRNRPLAKEGAISQKELQDSIQANRAAKAAVESAKASVEQAHLNLDWTRIKAPIDGVVGIAKAQIGDLVDQSTELTSMSTVDPIRVYFPVSEQEYLKAAEKVQRHYTQPASKQDEPELDLILSDGRLYPHRGRFFLADRQVDVNTGTIRIAALFPNPGNMLRPGQFARVRAVTKTREGALLVPQRAVSELQGSYQVAVVSHKNTIEIRPVKVGERINTQWIIDQGLKPGEQVVAEGLQKLKAGTTVKPKRFGAEPPVSAPLHSETPQKGR